MKTSESVVELFSFFSMTGQVGWGGMGSKEFHIMQISTGASLCTTSQQLDDDFVNDAPAVRLCK